MRNAFWCAGFAVAAAAVFAVLILGLSLPSGTVVEKIINCTVFALTWITGALLLSGAVHCFRNIFSGPSVVLTNETLWVQRKGEMAVADIDTEKTEILKNKVIFHDKNGNIRAIEVPSTDNYLMGYVNPPSKIKVIGGKTGTTDQAGSCLILLSKNAEGREFVSVVLGAIDGNEVYTAMNRLLRQERGYPPQE